MPTLYCDESGYTGTDLLSEEQPFFVISSLMLDEDEVSELAAPLSAVTQAPEIKYSNLGKWPKSRETLLAFTRQLDTMQNRLRFHLANKRYALLGKVVDLLVEPVMHASGINFYADGMNVGFLNALYVGGEALAKIKLDAVLTEFLSLCRNPTDRAYSDLDAAVRALSSEGAHLRNLCEPILLGIALHHRLAPDDLDKADLALVTACMIRLIRQWNCECDGGITVVADASSELFRSTELLEALADPDLPEVSEVSAEEVMGLPLQIDEFKLVDSKTSLGVQLADVAAGIVNHVQVAIDSEEKRIHGYSDELIGLVSEWPRMLQIIPEAKFTPEQLGRVGFDGSRILDATMDALKRGDQESN